MTKIILTGATGYIGRGLVSMLESAGYEVICLVRSAQANTAAGFLCRKIPATLDELVDLLKEYKPDAVVHLASLFLASHRPDQVSELIESNIRFPAQLLEAMKSTGVRRFLNTGTIFQCSDGGPGSPFNLYAATKQAFEDILHHYARNEGFTVLTLRLADTYGIGDTRRKLVQLLVDAAMQDEELRLTPGEQLLSLTWVDDVRRGFLLGLERLLAREGNGQDVFGLCNPDLVRVRDVGRIVQDVVGREARYLWGERPYRHGEIMVPVLPELLPGWSPWVSLKEGVTLLCEYGRAEKQ